jgi:hypothetical protein
MFTCKKCVIIIRSVERKNNMWKNDSFGKENKKVNMEANMGPLRLKTGIVKLNIF